MTDMPRQTPFHGMHVQTGAKMVPFAGYTMPIQYPEGILREHEWVRTRAGLFDVSHMGQLALQGPDAAANLARLTPTRFAKTAPGRCKYTVLTNDAGGIIDDLIVTKLADDTFNLVVNGARKEEDMGWIKQHLTGDVRMTYKGDHAPLVALQGPYALQVLQETLIPSQPLAELPFMTGGIFKIFGEPCLVTRSGYTGEDGFELALPTDPEKCRRAWDLLLGHADVRPIGLGARDSLRLEMGYPLYGHDLDETTSPVEAALTWVMTKNHDGFIGSKRILAELQNGAKRTRVGILITEKGIAREGSTILSTDGRPIGTLTSGGFSPTTKESIGQGYVETAHAKPGHTVLVEVRSRRLRATVHDLCFVNTRPSKPVA